MILTNYKLKHEVISWHSRDYLATKRFIMVPAKKGDWMYESDDKDNWTPCELYEAKPKIKFSVFDLSWLIRGLRL